MASSDRESQDKPAGSAQAPDARRDERAERLARALRENLKRRKQQARARVAAGKAVAGKAGDADSASGD